MKDVPKYGQPTQNTTVNELNTPQKQEIIINHQGPPTQSVTNIHTTYGTQPITQTCPFCKKPVVSKVSRSCSVGSVFLCICTCFTFWVCVQCCRNKEITCCDAKHTCPNCNKTLGYYENC